MRMALQIAFYILSAVLIIGMAYGLYYIIQSKMNRHRGWQRAAAVEHVLAALPPEPAWIWHRSA